MANLIKPQEVVNTGIVRAAPTTTRFDINLFSPHITDAEERFVLPYLTQDLYDAMIAAQNPLVSNYNPDVGPTVEKFPSDANYETLWLKYVLRMTAWGVYYQALPFIGMQTSSQGIMFNDTEFANNGGLPSIKFMQDTCMHNIERIQDLLTEYLCDNKDTYPLFDTKDCPCDTGCNDGCNDCSYYWRHYGTLCPTCKTHKNNSSGIIFYD